MHYQPDYYFLNATAQSLTCKTVKPSAAGRVTADTPTRETDRRDRRESAGMTRSGLDRCRKSLKQQQQGNEKGKTLDHYDVPVMS